MAEIDSDGSVFAHTHINQVADHGHSLVAILHRFCLHEPEILEITDTILVLGWLTCILRIIGGGFDVFYLFLTSDFFHTSKPYAFI